MHIPISVLIWAAAILGLLFGSFLNVCIVRLPLHQSIAAPPSHCPTCNARIRAVDNVPIASWLILRGKCRSCKSQISIQYPLVELGTALLWIACVAQTGVSWQTLIDAVACFLLLGLAVMDWKTMLLPDAFTVTGIVIAFVLRVFAPGAHSRAAVALQTAIAAGISAGILLAVWGIYYALRRRHGLGMGDVKLMAMVAALLCLPLALFTYFVGIIAAALFAIALLARGRAQKFDRIPLGTFLAAAAILAIFAARPTIAWYLGFFR